MPIGYRLKESQVFFEFQCRSLKSFHAEFQAKLRLLQQKIVFEFELDFGESTPYPRTAGDNDSRLRQNGGHFPK
jgi:hypothetical protein